MAVSSAVTASGISSKRVGAMPSARKTSGDLGANSAACLRSTLASSKLSCSSASIPRRSRVCASRTIGVGRLAFTVSSVSRPSNLAVIAPASLLVENALTRLYELQCYEDYEDDDPKDELPCHTNFSFTRPRFRPNGQGLG